MNALKNTLIYLAGLIVAFLSLAPFIIGEAFTTIADYMNVFASWLMDKGTCCEEEKRNLQDYD